SRQKGSRHTLIKAERNRFRARGQERAVGGRGTPCVGQATVEEMSSPSGIQGAPAVVTETFEAREGARAVARPERSGGGTASLRCRSRRRSTRTPASAGRGES